MVAEKFKTEEGNPEITKEPDFFYKNETFPSLLIRIKALFIDFCILLMVFAIMSLLVEAVGTVSDWVKGVVLIFMVYLYDPVFVAFTGSTLGHKAMKIKVMKFKEPEMRISFGRAFIRFLVKGLLGWISFLTVTGTKQKRAIHDLASGSIVIFQR